MRTYTEAEYIGSYILRLRVSSHDGLNHAKVSRILNKHAAEHFDSAYAYNGHGIYLSVSSLQVEENGVADSRGLGTEDARYGGGEAAKLSFIRLRRLASV